MKDYLNIIDKFILGCLACHGEMANEYPPKYLNAPLKEIKMNLSLVNPSSSKKLYTPLPITLN